MYSVTSFCYLFYILYNFQNKRGTLYVTVCFISIHTLMRSKKKQTTKKLPQFSLKFTWYCIKVFGAVPC